VPGPALADIEGVFREEYGRAVAVLTRVFGDIDIAAGNALEVDLEAVTGEMLAHIDARDLVLLARLVGDDDDLDLAGIGQ